MTIYTTRKSLMEGEGIKRALFEKLCKLGIVKIAINQKGKKVGFYILK